MRLLLYIVVMGNITLLFIVFLYPRLVFMMSHWGASERTILLSEGPRDNPNMGHLRKIYKRMYFVKDHSEEDSVIYFINPYFTKAEAYKILLPRKVKFSDIKGRDMKDIEGFHVFSEKRLRIGDYLVFSEENKPDFCSNDEVIWDESGWGIYKVR